MTGPCKEVMGPSNDREGRASLDYNYQLVWIAGGRFCGADAEKQMNAHEYRRKQAL